MSEPIRCEACGGRGRLSWDDDDLQDCGRCNGSGMLGIVPTPEQPAVTGEPLEPDFPPGEGFSNEQAAALGYALAGRTQENIGIPQTSSGPSRPAVESEGSASEVAPARKRYVCGFALHGGSVALIEKQRPDWQRGKWNGVGGRIEAGESDVEAMRREFREETGVEVDLWEVFATMRTDHDTEVVFLRAFLGEYVRVRQTTDERPAWWPVAELPATIPNLNWLIPMALHESAAHGMPFRIEEANAPSQPSTRDPVSRTLGATELPREDSTDVDRAWYVVEHSAIYDPPVVQRAIAQLRSQLSSTRTALQRVRADARAFVDSLHFFDDAGLLEAETRVKLDTLCDTLNATEAAP